jgi:hypothetical protein
VRGYPFSFRKFPWLVLILWANDCGWFLELRTHYLALKYIFILCQINVFFRHSSSITVFSYIRSWSNSFNFEFMTSGSRILILIGKNPLFIDNPVSNIKKSSALVKLWVKNVNTHWKKNPLFTTLFLINSNECVMNKMYSRPNCATWDSYIQAFNWVQNFNYRLNLNIQ